MAFWPSFPPTAAGRGGKKGKRPTVQYGKPTYYTCCFQTCDMPTEYIVLVFFLPAAERKRNERESCSWCFLTFQGGHFGFINIASGRICS